MSMRPAPSCRRCIAEAQRLIEEDGILFIGHAGHPEVIGTFGQVPAGSMTLLETVEDVADLNLPDSESRIPHADDPFGRRYGGHGRGAEAAFPGHPCTPERGHLLRDVNRQAAVKAIAMECDRMIVIGAPNSNSLRLAEVSERMGVPSRLIERRRPRLGVARRASHAGDRRRLRPEVLVRELLDALRLGSTSPRKLRYSPRTHDVQAPAQARRLTELPLVEIFTDGKGKSARAVGPRSCAWATGAGNRRRRAAHDQQPRGCRGDSKPEARGGRHRRLRTSTDNNYVRDGITLESWQRGGSHPDDAKPVKNAEAMAGIDRGGGIGSNGTG